MDQITKEIEKTNIELEQYMASNIELSDSINNIFGSEISCELFDESVYKICVSLGLEDEYKTYIMFDDIIDSGKKINVSFKKRKKDE